MVDDKQVFIESKLQAFKDFVLDAMKDGVDAGFSDHFEFLKMCMSAWVDMEVERGEE